jgi:uncharacterized protein YukE
VTGNLQREVFMIRRKYVQRTHKYEGWLSDDDQKRVKTEALLDAIDDSDKALKSLTDAMKLLSSAIMKGTDFWGGDEVMAIRDVHGDLNSIYRKLRNAVNDLEKEVKGAIYTHR